MPNDQAETALLGSLAQPRVQVDGVHPEDGHPTVSPFRRKPPLIALLRFVVRIFRMWRLRVLCGKRLVIGKDVVIGPGADIRVPHEARIADHVAIGKNFTAEADFQIGSEVLVSANVSFIGNHHAFDDPNSTVYRQGRHDHDKIVLEGDNLIGYGAIILGTVVIGRGAIIGAGSVVTKDMPPNWVCAGVPARPLRPRY